jgi:hypothetical protein
MQSAANAGLEIWPINYLCRFGLLLYPFGCHHGSQNRWKPLGFCGKLQNRSGSVLKTDQKTELVTIAKWFTDRFWWFQKPTGFGFSILGCHCSESFSFACLWWITNRVNWIAHYYWLLLANTRARFTWLDNLYRFDLFFNQSDWLFPRPGTSRSRLPFLKLLFIWSKIFWHDILHGWWMHHGAWDETSRLSYLEICERIQDTSLIARPPSKFQTCHSCTWGCIGLINRTSTDIDAKILHGSKCL